MSRSPFIAIILTSLALAGCSLRAPSMPADAPLSREEVAFSKLTVSGDRGSALYAAFVRALADEGFQLVDHRPYHLDLEVTLSVVSSAQAPTAVAKLRSDDFFVEDASTPDVPDPVATARKLAHILAVSQALAEFVRNGGTPQQAGMSAQ
jgi:hypothetical protein